MHFLLNKNNFPFFLGSVFSVYLFIEVSSFLPLSFNFSAAIFSKHALEQSALCMDAIDNSYQFHR